MTRKSTWLMIPVLLALAGCSHQSRVSEGQKTVQADTLADHSRAQQEGAPGAKADFESVPEVPLRGVAVFSPQTEGVKAVVTIENAPPGKHGIHVHQRGDCSDIAGKSMGEHFAPASNPHGLPGEPLHHLGDMGNIEVTEAGTGKLQIVLKDAALDKGPTSILGKALVIHEKEDIGTGPSGESGTPIACAVIEATD